MKNMQSTLVKTRRSLVFAAVIVLVTIGCGYAADSLDVPSITPLSEELADTYNKKPGIAKARNGFIERFGDERIVVISDASKRLAADARFYRKYNGTPISLSEIQVGTYVGYTVNDRAEINVMWIAE